MQDDIFKLQRKVCVNLLCRNILADALIGGDHLFKGGHLQVLR